SHDGRSNGANKAAYAVNAEHVEAVVIFEKRLERDHCPETYDTSDGPKHDGSERAGKARRRGNGDKTGHGTRECTKSRSMTPRDTLGQSPGKRASCGRGDGVEECLGSGAIGS